MDVPEIDVDELASLREGGVAVIDVRRPDEYERIRVPGTQLIPLGELESRVGEVPADGPVYVICQTGSRSHRAAAFLRHLGHDAINVVGGTKAWAEAGFPVETGDGT